MDTRSRFLGLFQGRVTQAGQSEPAGDGREFKGKERSIPVGSLGEYQELVRVHLEDPDSWGLGAYPVNEEGMTQWGCLDFDSKTSSPAADASYALSALRRAGLDGVVEVSRSGDGRHVWVFLDEWVWSDDLRKCLLLVDHAAGIECNEINPKQRVGTDFTKNTGNYVRLPYHAHWPDTMRALDEQGRPLDLPGFLDYAERHRSSAQRVVELAKRWHPTPPPKRHIPMKGSDRKVAGVTQDAHLIMRGDTVRHEGGFHDGRNNKLWNFARYLAAHPGYQDDVDSAHALMERVWSEQLEQSPDYIPLDVCSDMIRRAYEMESNA